MNIIVADPSLAPPISPPTMDDRTVSGILILFIVHFQFTGMLLPCTASSSIVCDQSSVSILPLVDDSTLSGIINVLHYRIVFIVTLFSSTIAEDDLIHVLHSVEPVSDWFSLGLALGLPRSSLKRVKEDENSVTSRLRETVSLWLDTGDASWKSLVQALLDPLVNKRDIAQSICERHPLRQ